MSAEIDKLFNINYLSQSNISLSRALLVFYVLIASQYTNGLMGKQLKTFFEENRIAQHIIGFIMMLVLIMQIGGVMEIDRALIYSIIGYVWFILTTKLDIQWNLIIIFMLLVGYLYESRMINKEDELKNDKVLTTEEKTNVITNNSNIKTYMVIGILIVTLLGTFLYSQKKQIQYGGSYNMLTFLFY